MGTVYRLVVSDGVAPESADPSISGPVTLDGGSGGTLVSGEYQALLVGTQIVPLPHPLETATIHKLGESYLSASLKGTFLRVTQRVCMKCGTLVDSPQIWFGAPGCLPSLVAGLAATAYVAAGDRTDLFDASMAGMGALCGSLLVTTFVGYSYAKLRWRKRQRSIAKSSCPTCGGKILRSIASLAGQTVPLEGETRSVTVTRASRS